MVKALELALEKAAQLPEAAQEQIGRDLLVYIDTLSKLRAEIEVGLRQLDAGLGVEIDLEEVIAKARREHAQF